ncbi:hypothetical protein EC988_002132 [Linderina pennispora]|nr:hypothetical protein EC988_002132 [Linderina pennispora]
MTSDIQDASAIVQHRVVGDAVEYEVAWADGAHTWEPSSSLADSPEALAQYWRDHITSNPTARYFDRDAPQVSKPKPLKRRAKPELTPEVDKMARIKGTQQRKELARSRAAMQKLAVASTSKPLPATAQRSREANDVPTKPPLKQTARKSMGRRV